SIKGAVGESIVISANGVDFSSLPTDPPVRPITHVLTAFSPIGPLTVPRVDYPTAPLTAPTIDSPTAPLIDLATGHPTDTLTAGLKEEGHLIAYLTAHIKTS